MTAIAGDPPSRPVRPRAFPPTSDSLVLAQFVLDDYSMRILTRINAQEASAVQLSRRCDIPIAACYRRLRRLEQLGLIAATRDERAPNGHWTRFFRSRLKSARIGLEQGRLWARVEVLPGEPENRPTEPLRGSFENDSVP
jgi:Helix-turn-helix domain